MILAAAGISLVSKKKSLDKLFSGINSTWNARNKLIPDYLKNISESTVVDKSLLEKIETLNNKVIMENLPPVERLDFDNKIIQSINRVNVAINDVPALIDNTIISELQSSIQKHNDQLASARSRLNEEIKDFNSTLTLFPANSVGRLMNYRPEQIVELEVDFIEEQVV